MSQPPPMIVPGLWAAACGGAESGRQAPGSIEKSKILEPIRRCENGLVTIRSFWKSFAAGILRGSAHVPSRSADYGPWQGNAFSRPAASSGMRRLRCGIFLLDESCNERPRRITDSALEEEHR